LVHGIWYIRLHFTDSFFHIVDDMHSSFIQIVIAQQRHQTCCIDRDGISHRACRFESNQNNWSHLMHLIFSAIPYCDGFLSSKACKDRKLLAKIWIQKYKFKNYLFQWNQHSQRSGQTKVFGWFWHIWRLFVGSNIGAGSRPFGHSGIRTGQSPWSGLK